MAGSLDYDNRFHIAGPATEKSPPTITAETMARHDEKTSAGRAKMLSGGDTGDRLAEVDEVLGCLVVQTIKHHEAELEHDPLWYIEPMQFGVQESRQAAVELVCTADHTSAGDIAGLGEIVLMVVRNTTAVHKLYEHHIFVRTEQF